MPGSAIPVEPSTVQKEFTAHRTEGLNRSPNLQFTRARSSLSISEVSLGDDDEEAAFQLWDTKRKITSFLMSSMKADADTMLVLVFTADKKSYMRSDMSRFDLLLECRKAVPEDTHHARMPRHLGEGSCHHTRGAMLQLRDIRALQDVQRPSLMVRAGAIVVSIEPLKAIITHDRSFVVVPEGADGLLGPLLNFVHNGLSDPQAQHVAFEFLALEALLVTLVRHHKQEVQR